MLGDVQSRVNGEFQWISDTARSLEAHVTNEKNNQEIECEMRDT